METSTTRDLIDDRKRHVLHALACAPDLSQRELAQQTGLSLTKAHLTLRELIDSGLVKVESSNSSSHRLGFSYVLTNAGKDLHNRMVYKNLCDAVERFGALQLLMKSYVASLVQNGVRMLALLGRGPVRDAFAELVDARQELRMTSPQEADLVIACDPEAVVDDIGTAQVVFLDEIVGTSSRLLWV